MAIITMNSLSAELTPKELAELEELEKRPIVFDDDCPEMTEEKLKKFHRMDSVIVKISSDNMKKIKDFGGDSRDILSKLLNLAINDIEMVKKCI